MRAFVLLCALAASTAIVIGSFAYLEGSSGYWTFSDVGLYSIFLIVAGAILFGAMAWSKYHWPR